MTTRKTKSHQTGRRTPAPRKNVGATSEAVRPQSSFAPAETIQAAIRDACRAFDSNRKRDIASILPPFQSQTTSLDSDNVSLYFRLLGFGLASSGKLVEAEQSCLQALSSGVRPESDIHFVLAFVYASLKDFKKARDHADLYFAKITIPVSNPANSPLTADSSHQSQMYNVLGGALSELRNFDQAEKNLSLAITSDPANHLPYLNLATLFMRTNQSTRAGEVVAQGIACCRHNTELKMVQQSLRHRPTISACMIVKNEEEMLAGCLESIRDWVDEIIVVDTGSSDRTVAIAESFNAKVFHQPWEGDFSKHRNYSLEQATSEWVFIIDADERFCADDVPVLQRLLIDKAHNILSISVYNVHQSGEETTTFLPSVRFFRQELKLRYKGIVHNSLEIADLQTVHRGHVRLFHYGYDLSPEKMEKKFQRTKALLEQQLADDPNNAYAHFNYAQVLRGDREGVRMDYADLVIRSAERAVELTDPSNRRQRSIHLMALNQLAWTNLYLHDYPAALGYCDRALCRKPDYLDPLLLKGHIASRLEKYDDAKRHYFTYLDAQAQYDPGKEIDNIILHHPDSRYIVWYSLGMIAHIEGDNERSKFCFEKVRAQQKNYLNTNSRLGALLMAEGNLAGAEACFHTQLQYDPNSLSAKLGIAYLHLRSGQLDNAQSAYRTVLQGHPGNQTALLKLGYLRLLQGSIQESSRLFAEAIKNGCDHAEIRQAVNDYIGATQNYETGALVYESLFAEGIQSAILCNEAGGCWFRLGQFGKAERWFEESRLIAPDEPLSLHNLGLARLRQEKFDRAISAFTEFLEKVPSATDVHLILGDLFCRTNDLPRAVQSFELFLSSCPTNPLVLFNLAECYFKMGHHSSALLGYRRVIALDPSASRAQSRIAEIEQSAFPAASSRQSH
ncbi:MAG: tetratricopeptide repeat protein [Candidatus Zixiibacteriota bacterium]